MGTDIFYKLTGSKYILNKLIYHITINYIDDSSNIIFPDNSIEL